MRTLIPGRMGVVGLTAPLLMLAVSCSDDTVVAPPEDPADFSTPEGIVEALEVSYRTRDIDLYAELLAVDFRFQFQEVDQAENGVSWTRDQDSTGTEALFDAPEVESILVELVPGPREDPESGFDADVRRIRMTSVQLEVGITFGFTLLVTDLQDMYFRPGRESLGEDPARWYLLEWRDLPPSFSSRPTVESATWGKLKALFG